MPDNQAPERRGVTWRSIIVALLLMPFNAWWVFMMEIIRYSGHPTNISLFFNSIFFLLLLIVANQVIKRVAPKLVFSQAEMLTIYIMINIASALVSHDFIQVLVPAMTHPHWFASETNQWKDIMLPYLPSWLHVTNQEALRGFYSGNSSLFYPDVIVHWIKPLLCWSGFIIVMVMSMLCLVTLLRKQWTERERLAYPLVQLPLDMTTPGSPLFRNKLMWLGFAVAAGIDIYNGISYLAPQFPAIPIKNIDVTTAFTTPPWNAIGWFPICLYPFAIGLGILLPLDLSFSCWFFFWIWKLERVMIAAWGSGHDPAMPYVPEQSFGAYIGIAVFAIWASRRHFALLLRGAFDWKLDLDDKNEPVPYRVAGFGFVIGVVLMVIFAVLIGMSIQIALLFFSLYFLLSLAITRMRAELGPPAHDLHDAGPDKMIAMLGGTENLGKSNLVAFSHFFWFNRAYRSHPMPFMLEGFKMGERVRADYRRLGIGMTLAVIVGAFCGLWAAISLCYKYGAAANIAPPIVPVIYGAEPFNRLESWLRNPAGANVNVWGAVTMGFAITIVLNTLRMTFPWFPFHPVGYAVSSTWSMSRLWICLMIAWMIKLLLLRYGGLKTYRNALPFFMGLILGECVVGSFWTLTGILFNIPTYAFWP